MKAARVRAKMALMECILMLCFGIEKLELCCREWTGGSMKFGDAEVSRLLWFCRAG
jgi:hypothetical protein